MSSPAPTPPAPFVSLFDAVEEGKEYASLASLNTTNIALDLGADLKKAVADIEQIRQRPLICYAGNITRAGEPNTSIDLADDVPFSELVNSIDPKHQAVDIMVATPGGSAHQVHNFVCRLRTRFDHVAFLIPHMAMSAGTIWSLSGNEIIMDERGFLGPIDPQVPNREGRWVPAQALFTLLKKIQDEGAAALKAGGQPTWTNLQLLKNIDAKELGAAVSATNYSIQLASTYLSTYKFAGWKTQAEREKFA